MSNEEARLVAWFEEHRGFLWGLCYRITGNAADADDLVQETFMRACQHAPERLDEPRRWLVRVAVNVARDLLRRRKRRRYVGPWLPSPIDTVDDQPLPSYEPMIKGHTLEGRYDLLESVSLAFLQALEALTPTQRAVLLLCDVFDYSAAETASALDLSEGNIRTIHHRARHAMEGYERHRSVPTPLNKRRTLEALQHFLELLGRGDVRGIERMLAADVRSLSDGGGEFTAARRPIVGPIRVARFFARLAASRQGPAHVTLRTLNAFPAAIVEFESPSVRRPPRIVVSLEVNGEGRIAAIRVIASSRKLSALTRSLAPGS
jgi:RNA polymerase sigma-70 factor (ECF subfamily)